MCLLRLLLATILVAFIDSYFDIFNGLANCMKYNNYPLHNVHDISLYKNKLVDYYNVEFHRVTTEDGYILTIQRIQNEKRHRAPVLLMHGILDSGDSWILQGPNSLGNVLANQGYDVWLGNARGNTYSRSHVKISSDAQQFWNFTWEEIGMYDLPATIDYILNETAKKDIFYVGHSQGTTSFFVMNSLKPEYNKKIKMMFGLAPVAWLKNIDSSGLRYLSKLILFNNNVLDVYSSSTNLLKWISELCRVVPWYCFKFMSTLVGSDNGLIDSTFLPVVYTYYPSTSSILQFVHYAQLLQSGRFRRFDYRNSNIFKYGQTQPPDYNLSAVEVPVTLFYSQNDYLVHPSDVKTLIANLPNIRKVYNVSYFNHLDYLYASCAINFVYNYILSDMDNFI